MSISREAQERLEYAQEKYKPGMSFISANPTSVNHSTGGIYIVDIKKSNIYMNDSEENVIWNGNGHGRIYNRGVWAEILKNSKNEQGI